MSFTDAEKVDIRFFCGYPVYGALSVTSFGWRYFTSYGLLEFRLNNLTLPEEVWVRCMVADLKNLYSDIYGARDNLDTDRAAVWYRNKNEVSDRERLFVKRRILFCDYLGIPYKLAAAQYSMRMVN